MSSVLVYTDWHVGAPRPSECRQDYRGSRNLTQQHGIVIVSQTKQRRQHSPARNTRQREKPSSHERQETQSASATSTTTTALREGTAGGKILATVADASFSSAAKVHFLLVPRACGTGGPVREGGEKCGCARCKKQPNPLAGGKPGLHVSFAPVCSRATNVPGGISNTPRTTQIRRSSTGKTWDRLCHATPRPSAVPDRFRGRPSGASNSEHHAYFAGASHHSFPQSDLAVRQESGGLTWKKHTKRGTQRAPFLCTAGKSARRLSGRSAPLRADECAASWPSPGRTGGRADQVRRESSVAGTANVDRRGAIGVRHRVVKGAGERAACQACRGLSAGVRGVRRSPDGRERPRTCICDGVNKASTLPIRELPEAEQKAGVCFCMQVSARRASGARNERMLG
ncbi:hypothetical protein pipiens_008227 [Culex pipiens pipiens]|uniref:Uncharacterized protein n=1 Tax=Culex pipiens pipiens TaxID=38569 RepID=A0ABD1DJK3_CULPP